jgi:AAA domain-containing protein
MPEPTRIRPPQSNNKPRPILRPHNPTGILATGVPVQDLVDEWVHLFLYGRNGVGKTTLACQFPKPLALIALEMTQSGGAKSVKRIDGVTVFRPTIEKIPGKPGKFRFAQSISSWLEELVEAFHTDKSFQSVVLDHGSILDEYILAEVCGWVDIYTMNKFGKVSGDQYTERSERMRNVLLPFFRLEKNFILLANEKDHNPSMDKEAQAMARRVVVPKEAQQGSFFSGAMGGGTTRWVQDASDYIGQLYMDEGTKKVARVTGMGKNRKTVWRNEPSGEFVRQLRLKYHPNFMARGRMEDPDNVPNFVGGKSAKEMYENFMSVVNGTYKVEEEGTD